MTATAQSQEITDSGTQRELAGWVSGLQARDVRESTWTWARHALIDWFGVTIAGAREPLADILVAEFAGKGDTATLVARNARTGLYDGALVNGAMSHALDFDDVNERMHGHPTVPVAAAVLALAEELGSSGRDVLLAFIAGYEVECRLGWMSGEEHYDKGFHSTGTMGTFGAAAGAARLMGLDAEQTAMALGIAASQASGLKVNFGTMTKPLHVGKAAMNGLIAARLAARGFTARADAIEAPQGFAAALVPRFTPGMAKPVQGEPLLVEQNLFKYHAACYLTHSSIEAVKELRRQHHIGLDDLKSMTLYVRPGHLTVCNIPDPRDGLEMKFSMRHLAAMALDGADTAALDTYCEKNALDPRYAAARAKVRVETVAGDRIPRHGATVAMDLVDGRTLLLDANVGVPASDVAGQAQKLAAKFRALVRPVLGEERTEAALAVLQRFEEHASVKPVMDTVA